MSKVKITKNSNYTFLNSVCYLKSFLLYAINRMKITHEFFYHFNNYLLKLVKADIRAT